VGNQNQQNIAFLINAVLLPYLNNTQKTYFVNFLDTLADISSNCFVFSTAYSKIAWNMGTLCEQAWRCFPHSFTAVSIVLLQTNPDFSSHFSNS